MSVLHFTRDHEWVRVEADGIATVGISDYAQEQLGDVVYVELPETGSRYAAGDELAVVESVKAVGEIYMPLSGTVQSVNEQLIDQPELVNAEPTDGGWLFKISLEQPEGVADLMDEAAYRDLIATL